MTNDKLRELADALSHQQQADMDGVLCTVSRQAVDEAIAFLRECAAAPTPPAQADVRVPTEAQIDYRALYHDLLFAVGNKHAGETRHETALRYIREAERSDGAALAAKDDPT